MTADDVKSALQVYAHAEDVEFLPRFFKTAEGQYGAGDIFIGVRVPQTRAVCKAFKELPLIEVERLLASGVHEHRLAAVILLSIQFAEADVNGRRAIYETYLQAVFGHRINNWDIVDSSAALIVGEYLWDKPRELLFQLARNESIWQRRVAILSAFAFVKKGDASTTLRLAEVLLHDPQDLIQKAVGWMLREVGKRCDESLLLTFLESHADEMPRTMLRYSIERLSPEQKTSFMKRKSQKEQ